ncbi:MAG: hypothetical protein GXO60_05535 [Epsilonproteobacteria bacterium]|nr:hypothetical protein [Campylobacterota bacterium]
MWLKNLIGFDESKEAIYKNITVKDRVLTSKVNTIYSSILGKVLKLIKKFGDREE